MFPLPQFVRNVKYSVLVALCILCSNPSQNDLACSPLFKPIVYMYCTSVHLGSTSLADGTHLQLEGKQARTIRAHKPTAFRQFPEPI